MAANDSSQNNLSTGLPEHWEVRHSKSKQLPYYFNCITRDSSWEPPAGTNLPVLERFIAASNHAHAGSRRPASWKDANITRTKDEARVILEGYEREIREGRKTLAQLAATESDCSSARKGGDLGVFGHGEMQRAFEDAAFALEVGEVSGVVETASGLHLIERLG